MLGDWAVRLEGLALRVFDLPEQQLWLGSMAFLVLGGAVAALFKRGTLVLSRAPYFALSASVALAITLGQMIWVQSGVAMVEGWLWALMGVDVLFNLVWGYLLVALGQARSRDMRGHGRLGFLAIVPLAHLWLLTAKGAAPSEVSRVPALLRGGVGVALGIVLVIGARVAEQRIVPMVEKAVMAATGDPAHGPKMVDIRVQQVGLARTLQEFALASAAGVDLGDGLTLQRVVAMNPTTLRYHYTLDGPEPELAFGAANMARIGVCDDPVLSRLMAQGAVIDIMYLTPAEEMIDEFFVRDSDCGV